MHVQQCGMAWRCRGPSRLRLLAASLGLAVAACSGVPNAVMAPPNPDTSLALPPADTTTGFCNSLAPAQRAAEQLCNTPPRP